MQIKGAIFDMDGTLLDTEEIYVQCWGITAKKWGIEVPLEFITAFMGSSRKEIERRFKGLFGQDFDFEKFRTHMVEEVFKIFDESGIPIKKGAVEILEYLKKNNIPMAVATSTHSDRALLMLERSGLSKYFDAVVCGEDIEKGKPDPDIFIEAARRIGKNPKECLGIEDSRNGILSVKRAGMTAVLVPDMVEVTQDMKDAADYISDDLNMVLEIIKDWC